jgi:tetratricopeptide (TPR) repeat protein
MVNPNIRRIALIGTIIFAVHPIHTEVVANIKGRDELLAAFFLLLSLHEYLRYLNKGKVILLGGAAVLFFLGLLSKENALTLIPVAGFLTILTGKRYFVRASLGFGILLLPLVLYLWIRIQYAGGLKLTEGNELMNNPFLFAGRNEKLPTILLTLVWYLKLLVWPHPLTFDYYPYHVSLVTWDHPLVWLSLLIYMLIFAGVIYYFFRIPFLSFCLAFYVLAILPFSNLFINVGTFMNERFLFQPSIAFVFAVAYGLVWLAERNSRNKLAYGLIVSSCILLLLLGALKTVSRNRIWKDNFTLFLNDIQTSSGSAKGNCMAGGILYEEALKIPSESRKEDYLRQSEKYLLKSLSIYPEYIDALMLLGNVYYTRDKGCRESMRIYQKLLSYAPNYNLAYANLKTMLAGCDDPNLKIRGYTLILRNRPGDYEANYQKGSTYGKALHKMDSAIVFLRRAVEISTNNELANRDLGVAYASSGQYKAAVPYFEKALEVNPEDPDNYINLGITLRQLGFTGRAGELFVKADSLKGN